MGGGHERPVGRRAAERFKALKVQTDLDSVGELGNTVHLSGLKASRKVERGLSGSSTF